MRMLREEGRRHVDDSAIFEQIEKMRAVVTNAGAAKKKALRQAERLRQSFQSNRNRAAIDVPLAPQVDEPCRPAPTPYEVEEWW